MDAFLSRITRAVRRDGGADGGKGGGKGGSGVKSRRSSWIGGAKSGGWSGRAGSGGGSGRKSGGTSGGKNGGRSGSKSGGRSGASAKTGTRPKSRPKATSGSKRSGTRGTAPAGASAARKGPSPVLRVFSMLLAFGAMVGFAVVLSRLTLEPSQASEAIAHTNLEPGASIRAYLSQPAFRDTVKQLGGNIVLGVPFGVLLPVLLPRARGLLRVTGATAVVMLLVELVQGALITGRAFDIDDVILNSSGALLGYLLLGRMLGRAVHPPRRRWWERWMGGPVAG
ncbi:VanZ family protein [Streptomyces sp. TR06-5]|uniref:VanZ family protein n=1 Tax=Streptomyces sp. TR06-5 TaxID=3385976 RepID=UPI0039A373B5